MKIIALGAAAALALSTSASAMSDEPVHGLRINPHGLLPCTHGLLPFGYMTEINTGTRKRPHMTKVSVFKPGVHDRMTVGLSFQASAAGHFSDVGKMVFDQVNISGVCRITADGEIDTSPGGSPVVDVTIGFDQPATFDWPPPPQGPQGQQLRPYFAIQSTLAQAPATWCSLTPGTWAWPPPNDQPSIDPAGHLRFTMPKKVGQTLTYQLYYVRKGGGSPRCIDPDIINH
ncbi:MAG TPA: hypothetical protein VIJ59_09670 [Caulobacteraceae bacterium]